VFFQAAQRFKLPQKLPLPMAFLWGKKLLVRANFLTNGSSPFPKEMARGVNPLIHKGKSVQNKVKLQLYPYESRDGSSQFPLTHFQLFFSFLFDTVLRVIGGGPIQSFSVCVFFFPFIVYCNIILI
jgi:hypothetical protein